MVRQEWVHTGSVAPDELRFARAITHAHLTRDEQIAWLRANDNALHAFDLERTRVARTITLDRSQSWVGFVESGASLRALQVGAHGATLLALESRDDDHIRACAEPVAFASVAPDHQSATLLLETGELVVIDGAGAIVRRASRVGRVRGARVIALTADRAVVCERSRAVVVDLRSGADWVLSVEAQQLFAAVDHEHVLVREMREQSPAGARWAKCTVARCTDGAVIEGPALVLPGAYDRDAVPSVATREGTLFSLDGPICSLLDPSQCTRGARYADAVLAFGARWMVHLRTLDGAAYGIAVRSRDDGSERSAELPVGLSLSPDGAYLLDDNAIETRIWHTPSGACLGALPPTTKHPRPQWLRGGDTVALVESDADTPRRAQVVEIGANGPTTRAQITLEGAFESTSNQWNQFVAFSPDGLRALVQVWREWPSPRWFELAYDEAAQHFVWPGDELRDPVLTHAIEHRYTHDGALEVLSDRQWLRRERSGWIEVASPPGEILRFAGPGVEVDHDDAPYVCTADGRALRAEWGELQWASDALVFATVIDGALVVTDAEAQHTWTLAIDSEASMDRFSLSGDGRSIAVVDGRDIKIFRRTAV